MEEFLKELEDLCRKCGIYAYPMSEEAAKEGRLVKDGKSIQWNRDTPDKQPERYGPPCPSYTVLRVEDKSITLHGIVSEEVKEKAMQDLINQVIEERKLTP